MSDTIINLDDDYRIKGTSMSWMLQKRRKLKDRDDDWALEADCSTLAYATRCYINLMMRKCGATSFEDLLAKTRAIVDAACIPSITLTITEK